MRHETITIPAFVIKAEELSALNYLAPNHPRPLHVEWINRGTDQKLRPSSVDMLLRTLFHDVASPSVVRLHRSAGLRAIFRTGKERDQFAAQFAAARSHSDATTRHHVTALFDDHEHADRAVSELKAAGIPASAISELFLAAGSWTPAANGARAIAG